LMLLGKFRHSFYFLLPLGWITKFITEFGMTTECTTRLRASVLILQKLVLFLMSSRPLMEMLSGVVDFSLGHP
jgi:hypothetical protein